MSEPRHLILGGGTAGLNAIRTLRQLGDTGEITLVSAEPPYSRMVLPYYLEGGISESHATTASPRQLERWGVKTRIGLRARALDARARTLRLDNDETIGFEQLLIATGSSAVRPKVPGADRAGVHTFWTLADAQAVHRHIRPRHHVVLVGAGFIAFTILNALLTRAGRLTIVEVEPRILPRMVDAEGARLAAQRLTERGVTLRTATRLTRIARKGRALQLEFDRGEPLKADLVLMATGIAPNIDWLRDSGLALGAGIQVDRRLQSSAPGIYAAGDVAEGPNRIGGASEVHAIEPTAMEHGRVAGANMAGQDVAYEGSLLMNIVSVAGLDMASFGAWNDPEAEIVTGLAAERPAYRKYLFRDGRMVGAIMIGSSDATWRDNDLGMLKGLVQSGIALGPWKDYLRAGPFGIKQAYLASGATAALLPATVLGRPAASPDA